MTETRKAIPMFCPNCGKMNYGYTELITKLLSNPETAALLKALASKL